MSKWKNAKKVRISSERNSGNACIMCHARPIMGGWVPHISAKCQCVQNIVPHSSANGVQQQARGRSLHCFPELLQLAKCHLHLFSGFVKILLMPMLPVNIASSSYMAWHDMPHEKKWCSHVACHCYKSYIIDSIFLGILSWQLFPLFTFEGILYFEKKVLCQYNAIKDEIIT